MEPQWAIILDIWKDEPIYHRHGGFRGMSEERRPITTCGRKIASYKPSLPMKHVKRFARPCKDCFPPSA